MFEFRDTLVLYSIFSCGVATHLQVLTRFAMGKQAFRVLRLKFEGAKKVDEEEEIIEETN
jgi:xanthine/uracil permease